MLKFIRINKEKEICLPNKEYIRGTVEKNNDGCQMHSIYACNDGIESLLPFLLYLHFLELCTSFHQLGRSKMCF